jgi:hypothetical protein
LVPLNHRIDLPTAAEGIDQALAPIENGRLGAVLENRLLKKSAVGAGEDGA